ncbi:MAG: 50S ribosomal protein L23 [Acetobacteraceae bacterium]|nr:50S ribosomal protein L23 [Acetobacteraceae bacterium]
MRNPREVVLKPIISEKSMAGMRAGKYTFVVARDATKTEIRGAVEAMFGVKVVRVNTINQAGRLRRMGYTRGFTPATKKAVVTLAPGQAIKAFEGMV